MKCKTIINQLLPRKEEMGKNIISNDTLDTNWVTHLDNIDDGVNENRTNSRLYKFLKGIAQMVIAEAICTFSEIGSVVKS